MILQFGEFTIRDKLFPLSEAPEIGNSLCFGEIETKEGQEHTCKANLIIIRSIRIEKSSLFASIRGQNLNIERSF